MAAIDYGELRPRRGRWQTRVLTLTVMPGEGSGQTRSLKPTLIWGGGNHLETSSLPIWVTPVLGLPGIPSTSSSAGKQATPLPPTC